MGESVCQMRSDENRRFHGNKRFSKDALLLVSVALKQLTH